MAPTLPSALILSAVGLWSKAFLSLTTRSLRVRGLDTLLDALKEHDAGEARARAELKGKGKAEDGDVAARELDQDGREESLVSRAKRRGIVTSECRYLNLPDAMMRLIPSSFQSAITFRSWMTPS